MSRFVSLLTLVVLTAMLAVGAELLVLGEGYRVALLRQESEQLEEQNDRLELEMDVASRPAALRAKLDTLAQQHNDATAR